jgi:hypothetical protein
MAESQPNTHEQYAQETPESRPNASQPYAQPIPRSWIVGFVGMIFLVTYASLRLNFTGTAVVVNILLSTLAGLGLWLLWLTPSAAGKIEIGEFLLGIWLVAVGMAIGSSPTVHPHLAKVWTRFGLNPKLVAPLARPNVEMWQYKNNQIKPTGSVPSGQILVVRPSNGSDAFFLTDEGFETNNVATLEVWLMDKGSGYTSPSIHFQPPQSK